MRVIFLLSLLVILINIAASYDGGCGGERDFFIEKSLSIDLFNLALRDSNEAIECYWKFTTSPDHILVLSSPNLEEIQHFIQIHDGLNTDVDKLLTTENQVVLEKSRKDLPPSVYTTGQSVLIRTDHLKMISSSKTLPIDFFNLRIAKAVNCPFNLGAESQCGRILDPESCYCATFTQRNWQGQYDYCKANNGGMDLVSLESIEEEAAIHSAWTTTTKFWMSLNDFKNEGIYIWASTGINMYPWAGGIGNANWAPTQPDNATPDEDCVTMNNGNTGWDDNSCTALYNAICELQPGTSPEPTTTAPGSTCPSYDLL